MAADEASSAPASDLEDEDVYDEDADADATAPEEMEQAEQSQAAAAADEPAADSMGPEYDEGYEEDQPEPEANDAEAGPTSAASPGVAGQSNDYSGDEWSEAAAYPGATMQESQAEERSSTGSGKLDATASSSLDQTAPMPLASQPLPSQPPEPQAALPAQRAPQQSPPEEASMTLLQQVSRGGPLAAHPTDNAQPTSSQAPPAGTPASLQSHASQGIDQNTPLQHPSSASGLQGEPAGHKAVPPGPRFLAPTMMMPKGPLQEYKNVSHEAVTMAFTPATLMGIRSLPNALIPGFREQLYQQMMDHHVAQRSDLRMDGDGPHPSSAPPRLAYALQVGLTIMVAVDLGGPQALGPTIAPGQRSVIRQHPYAGSFATYDYLPSEFERGRLGAKFEKLQAKLAQVTPTDFVVRAPPIGPKGTPAFSEFNYNRQPCLNMAQIQLQEDNAARAAALAGPFVVAGRAQSPAALRGRADACMMALCKQLTTDWPKSFMQVFEDKTGAIVVSFDRTSAVAEGDLSAYMQHLVKNHWVPAEYRLTKDGSQWGLEDPDTQSVFFLSWPPWVRHRFMGLPQAQQPSVPTQAQEEEAATDTPPARDPSNFGGHSGVLKSSGRLLSNATGAGRDGLASLSTAALVSEFNGMGALGQSAAGGSRPHDIGALASPSYRLKNSSSSRPSGKSTGPPPLAGV